ncbi:hypothetical protein CHS0354_040241, partial [Potamilus streckersoni]
IGDASVGTIGGQFTLAGFLINCDGPRAVVKDEDPSNLLKSLWEESSNEGLRFQQKALR